MSLCTAIAFARNHARNEQEPTPWASQRKVTDLLTAWGVGLLVACSYLDVELTEHIPVRIFHYFFIIPFSVDLLKDFGTISQWGQPYHLFHVLQSWSLGLFAWSDTVSVTSFTAEHPKLMKLQVRFIQQEDCDPSAPS